jgi:para-nitrobenzyl esterase
MLQYWTSFAAEGVPRARNTRAWTPFKNGTHVLRLDRGDIGYIDAATAHHCSFWQQLYPDLLSP